MATLNSPITESDQWVDCWETIKSGCSLLNIGEVLSTDPFNFRDAMQAMEIGDPKVDHGMYPAHSAYLLQEGLQHRRIPLPSALTVSQRVLLYDALLALLVEWLEGRMAPTQSIFTCAYLHDLSLWADSPDDATQRLRVFCQMFLQLCCELLGQINRARVFDPEDFIAHLCGISIDQNVATLPLLRDIADRFPFIIKLVSKLDPASPTLDEDYRIHLLFRLLAAMTGDINALNQAVEILTLFATFPLHVAQQQDPSAHLSPADLLPRGVLQPFLPHRMEPALQAGPKLKAPPIERYTKYFTQMLTDLHQVCTGYNAGSCSLQHWIRGDGLRDLTLPGRSMLDISNVEQIGVVLVQSFVAFGVPPEFISCELVQNFIHGLGAAHYKPFLEIYLFNRVRQRRAIGRGLLNHMPVIQHLAMAVDKKLQEQQKLLCRKYHHNRYFLDWSIDQTLQWMIRYLEEGIVQELFQPDELIIVFWYLDFLYQKLLELRQAMFSLTKELRESLLRVKARTQQRSTRGNSKAAKTANNTPIPSETAIDLSTPSLHQTLCRAIRQFLLALSRQQRLPPMGKTSPFAFSKRYKAFSRLVHPPPLQYQFFFETTKPITDDQIPELIQLSNAAFNQVCNELKKNPHFPDRQNLLKVCISNMVQIMRLPKSETSSSSSNSSSSSSSSSSSQPVFAKINFLPNCPYPLITI